ncbi:cytochrome P450 3A40-like isoform X1 [Lepisosteus oculatus]|uniref:cytochrome P450 3A40-like isoform X1 n=2 Tax=Lepisosteus oculatus TaxID=7918 RepID=UPI0035F50E42
MAVLPSLSTETWTLLVSFLTLLILYGIWPYSFFKKLGIPGPRPLPFFGNFLEFRKGVHVFDLECFCKFGKVWGVFEGRTPTLAIVDTAIIKTIMVKECYSLFTNRREAKMVGPMYDALSLVKDEKWKRIRSVLSPSFTSGRLKEVFPIAKQCADTLVINLHKKDRSQPVQIKDVIGPYSMDVVTSASFSVSIDSLNNPDDPFVTNVKKMLNFNFFNPILLIITIFPFTATLLDKLNFSLFPQSVMTFFYDSFRKIKAERKQNIPNNRVDFLQLMMDSQLPENNSSIYGEKEVIKGLTDHEILSQSLIFVFGGYEPTSTSLSFLAYNLATNPDVQKKLQKEIDEVFSNKAPVTYEALMKMEYLDMVISESLRLFPSPRLERMCKKTVEINGVTIPEGIIVTIPVYALHHDPDHWPEPDVFKPERFSKANKESMDPYAYLPFGTGPRNCIGMRFALMVMKLAVVQLLQSFSFETCKETQVPVELNAIFQPKKPITLKVVPRTPSSANEVQDWR